MMSRMTRPAGLLAFAALCVAFGIMALAGRGPALAQDGAQAPAQKQAQEQVQEPVAILAYHRFDRTLPGPTTVTTRVFEQQLESARRASLSDRALARGRRWAARHGAPVAAPAVAITVDDGHRSSIRS